MVRLTVTGGPAGGGDLLECGVSIEEADPLAVGREEEATRRAQTLERRGLELIEGAHEDQLGAGADVRQARAVRRDRDGRCHRCRGRSRRTGSPSGATTCGGDGRVRDHDGEARRSDRPG